MTDPSGKPTTGKITKYDAQPFAVTTTTGSVGANGDVNVTVQATRSVHIESQIVIASCIWFCRGNQSARYRHAIGEGGTYGIFVFNEALVETAQADKEKNARHVLETVNPLPPLALLPTNIDHEHVMFAQGEDRLGDTDRPRTGVDDVLLIGHIRRVEESVQIREVVQQASDRTGAVREYTRGERSLAQPSG